MLINTSLDCYWGPVLLSSSFSSGPYAGEVALYRSFNGALGPNGNGGIGRWYDGLNYAAHPLHKRHRMNRFFTLLLAALA